MNAVLAFLHSLVREHADAATGAVIGLTAGVAAYHHPAFADWPELMKIVVPLLSSVVPVAGKALVQYLKPAGRGLAAGMRHKATSLRRRAAKLTDQVAAEKLIERAENLEAEAAAIDAAEE